MRYRVSCVLLLACSCVAGSPRPAAAQAGVRVTQDEATVRERPDVQSAVVATLKAGTLLDGIQRGEWWEVVLPARQGETARRGYLPAAAVEVFPTAPAKVPGVSAPAGSPAPAAAGALAPDWQARYDRALAKKRSGRTKMFIAVPLVATGAVFSYYSVFKSTGDEEGNDRRYQTATYGGLGLALVGAGLVASASGDARSATRELTLLEAERQAAQAGAVKIGYLFRVGTETSAWLRLAW